MRRSEPSAALSGALGGKLGPRLVDLVSQSVIATRRGLAPHEAKTLAAGLQQTIDKMGEEHATFIKPITDALIARGELPPELAHSIGRAASGKHQWEARALQGIVAGSAQSALGTVISNYLFPVTGELVARGPALPPDVGTLAQLAAHRMITQGFGARFAAMQGTSGTWFELLLEGAYNYVTPELAIELIRRGDSDRSFLHHAMGFAGYHPLQVQALDPLIRTWLTPADAALGVLRGTLSEEYGRKIAEVAGLERGDFEHLVANTGEPLGLMQLLEAYRRKFIDRERLARGIRESRVRNEWIPVAEQLRYSPMSTADAADAALRGHLSSGRAQEIAAENGLEPEQWPAYFANQGNPPAPEQLLELWRRNYLDEATVNKGLREGRTRDEWIPAMRQLRYEPISTADAVDAWLRHHIDQDRARRIMAENGLEPRDHDIAFANAGNPLGLEELLEAYRRKLIDRAKFDRGFHQSRYRDEWAETALRLRYRPMSTADAIEALVQGHLPEDRARQIAEENGLAPADFGPLYQTVGTPLSPTEALELLRRKKITRDRAAQALREGRLKDKYIDNVLELQERLPEPRQIVTMLEYGAITAAEATRLISEAGYSEKVTAALVAEGESRATGGHRQLATAQITSLYTDKLIPRPEAAQLLERLHYTAPSAAMLLDLADHTRRQRILQTGITAVRAAYVHHRATDTEAAADLLALEIPHDAAQLYLQTWRLERAATTRTLTEAQVVKAYTHKLFSDDDGRNEELAMTRLRQLGYDQVDSALLLAGA